MDMMGTHGMCCGAGGRALCAVHPSAGSGAAGRGHAAGETLLDGSRFFQARVSLSLDFMCFHFLLKARCLISSMKNKALSAR